MLLIAGLLCIGRLACAAPAEDPDTAIRALLEQQVVDWNRGDLDGFASGYKNSPEILFMGATPRYGYAAMLAGYKERYPTRDAMGTLNFTDLKVHLLDPRFATTTGEFHLVRSVSEGGKVDGYFLLVIEKTAAGWKIVCDDTTVPPGPRK
jgi:ketosteroid isomerase-like protein